MTDQDTEVQAGTNRASGRQSSGRVSVLMTGVLTAGLVGLLVTGGVAAAGAITTVSSQQSLEAQEAPPTPLTGVETPVADPSTPPDRDSDQNVEPEQKDTVYNVQPGDTLTSISAELGVSVDAIAEYNAVRDVDLISEGSVLRVPFIYVPPTAANG